MEIDTNETLDRLDHFMFENRRKNINFIKVNRADWHNLLSESLKLDYIKIKLDEENMNCFNLFNKNKVYSVDIIFEDCLEKTFKDEASEGCYITTKVTSTGLKGGDAGHGGVTTVEISSLDGGGIGTITIDGTSYDFSNLETGIEFKVQGDWELMTLAKAFKNISKHLTDLIS